jgi:acyl carrier protein
MKMTDRTAIETTVMAIANETIADWGLDLPGGVTPNTRLVADLGFESMDVVQFAVAIERAFDRKGLPFEQLFMKDGAYVDDLSIAGVTDFLCSQLYAA